MEAFREKNNLAEEYFTRAAEAYARQVPKLGRGGYSIDVYLAWFHSLLGINTDGDLNLSKPLDRRALNKIREMIRGLPGEAAAGPHRPVRQVRQRPHGRHEAAAARGTQVQVPGRLAGHHEGEPVLVPGQQQGQLLRRAAQRDPAGDAGGRPRARSTATRRSASSSASSTRRRWAGWPISASTWSTRPPPATRLAPERRSSRRDRPQDARRRRAAATTWR